MKNEACAKCPVRQRAEHIFKWRPAAQRKLGAVEGAFATLTDRILDISECRGPYNGVAVGADCDWPEIKCANAQQYVIEVLANTALNELKDVK